MPPSVGGTDDVAWLCPPAGHLQAGVNTLSAVAAGVATRRHCLQRHVCNLSSRSLSSWVGRFCAAFQTIRRCAGWHPTTPMPRVELKIPQLLFAAHPRALAACHPALSAVFFPCLIYEPVIRHSGRSASRQYLQPHLCINKPITALLPTDDHPYLAGPLRKRSRLSLCAICMSCADCETYAAETRRWFRVAADN